MHAMYLMIVVLLVLTIAYRFYSRFIAVRVLSLDDSRTTPAHTRNDGQNYHPTNKWVLFGHHFAAISGAGPLLGPVLAAQFGYLPGLIWILVGVCLAGAVQDFVILTLSMRRNGKSLAQLAYEEIGKISGGAATIGILFVLIIALAGLGKAVVKALGGEEVVYPTGTRFVAPQGSTIVASNRLDPRIKGGRSGKVFRIQPGSVIEWPAGADGVRPTMPVSRVLEIDVEDNGTLSLTGADPHTEVIDLLSPGQFKTASTPKAYMVKVELPPDKDHKFVGWALEVHQHVKAHRKIAGSTWGTFSIFLTIPIALFTGWWMYHARKGKVLEASIIGGLLTLGAVYLGSYVQQGELFEALGDRFNLSEFWIGVAMAIYGFVASVLPVWVLLCPRDYLSSFLKIGTVVLLVIGVIVANPVLHAPAVNDVFLSGGPVIGAGKGIFPFVFITIMCGAISGFHALVSSGTTPKMISKESHARPIGYAAMLIEGLVAIIALIAASCLPTSHYYHMNTAWKDLPAYQQQIEQIAKADEARSGPAKDLGTIEQQVGESLQGRTGGAVTLAVGMSEIFDQALRNVMGAPKAPPAGAVAPGPGSRPAKPLTTRINDAAESTIEKIEKLIPYWYHFAIMFEALFILTTIDTGTRVGRFLLQESMGKWIYGKFGKTDWWPGAIICTALIVAGWLYFILFNSMAAIWPTFGVANQMLAVWALAVASVAIVRSGKGRYVWITLVPLAFVTVTTTTAAVIMVGKNFGDVSKASSVGAASNSLISGVLILAILACTAIILVGAVKRMGEKRA